MWWKITGCHVIGSFFQCPQPLPYAPETRWQLWAELSPSNVKPLAIRSLQSSGRRKEVKWDWPWSLLSQWITKINECISDSALYLLSRVSSSPTSLLSPLADSLSPRRVVWPLPMYNTPMAAFIAARLSTSPGALLPKPCWRSQTVSIRKETSRLLCSTFLSSSYFLFG